LVTWLVKIAVFVAVLGLIAIDGISVALGHQRIGDAASQAANAGAQGYGLQQNFAGALGAAEQAAKDNGGILLPQDFSITGNVVTAKVTGPISTIWLGLIPGTDALRNPTAVATATLAPQ
jgi:hypothetical protein